MTGKLIVFEGPDCVGKSTFSKRFYQEWKAQGCHVKRTCFPGDIEGTLGKMVYDLHHYKERFNINKINPMSLQMLHVAAHIDLIESYIKPWLEEGKTVILDRFYTSTYIYGTAYGVDVDFLEDLIDLEDYVWDAAVPDLMIIVDAEKPYEKDNHDHEMWQHIRQQYLDLPDHTMAMRIPIEIVKNVEEEITHTAIFNLFVKYGLVPESEGLRESKRLWSLGEKTWDFVLRPCHGITGVDSPKGDPTPITTDDEAVD